MSGYTRRAHLSAVAALLIALLGGTVADRVTASGGSADAAGQPASVAATAVAAAPSPGDIDWP